MRVTLRLATSLVAVAMFADWFCPSIPAAATPESLAGWVRVANQHRVVVGPLTCEGDIPQTIDVGDFVGLICSRHHLKNVHAITPIAGPSTQHLKTVTTIGRVTSVQSPWIFVARLVCATGDRRSTHLSLGAIVAMTCRPPGAVVSIRSARLPKGFHGSSLTRMAWAP